MTSLYEKQPAAIFGKSMVGVIAILFLGLDIVARGHKKKEEFYHITGPILSISDSITGVSDSREKKIRYIQIRGYTKTFELFIGKDFGDFKPTFEQLDKLKKGDKVTVYFDAQESNTTALNRLVQFVDKDQRAYFIKGGDQDKYWGWSAIGVSAGITALLFTYKKKGKIV